MVSKSGTYLSHRKYRYNRATAGFYKGITQRQPESHSVLVTEVNLS